MQATDWAVLLAYVALVLGIGWYVSRGTHSAEGHLRANRDLPAWAVVFSILAAEVSAATYVGVPESSFKGDWTYLQFAIGALIGKWVVSTWFVRLYWRLNLPTVYGLLLQRIGARSQRSSAWAFLCGRLVASGVRLYIAALAFSVVTGLAVWQCILLMAGISTLYTLIGGLKAVVWTDVAQGTVFFVGALTALAVGLQQIGLPVGQIAAEALEAGKLRLFALAGNPLASTTSLWSALLGGFLLSLAVQGTDQESVQHMLNTRSERSAGRTVFTSGLVTFPIVAAFLSVGTMLWAFQRHVGAHGYALGTPEEVKRVFPYFILHELPVGVRGLVFAGLFAAAISSLGATLNAAAAAWTHDIAPRARGHSLAGVRMLTGVFGLLLAGIGLFFDWFSKGSTTDLVQIALGAMTILYGGILGAFLVALFAARRGSDASVPLGMLAGVVCGGVLFFQKQILGHTVLEWPWSMCISTLVATGVGLAGRRATPPSQRT
jgi:SSS family transporter